MLKKKTNNKKGSSKALS